MAQLPIGNFLKARLQEYDSNFELRNGTGFESLFFKPLQFIVQPLRDEANDVFTSQSLLRILLTEDPNAYSETDVDDIVSNFFVFRRSGSQSSGMARAYYNEPVDREFPTGGAVFTGSNGKVYSNSQPFSISVREMELQLEDGLYYVDIPVQSADSGANTELPADELVSLAGDVDVVRVTNPVMITGGLDRETNTEYIERAQQSIGVRDLVAGKGFRAILFENFNNNLLESQPIGFGDPEMMRDVLFNAHIGGKVDGWVKTSRLTQGSKSFVGILTDRTRQTYTSANISLSGVAWKNLGNKSLDRTGNKIPVVKEIKPSSAAEYLSPVNMSLPLNLSVNQHIKLGIDGVFKNIKISGAVPSSTTRNEIVNLINAIFGQNVAFVIGTSIKLKSPTQGLSSQIVIANPDIGNSAINTVFGLSVAAAPHTFNGNGPVTYIEDVHYTINDADGEIKRIVGSIVLPTQGTGAAAEDSTSFSDPTSNIFLNVNLRDILTITSGPNAGDYRIMGKTDSNNLLLDKKLLETETSVSYTITRTGIKSGELVYIQYYYNPLSIDIGKNIPLDQYGRVRGIRPGREEWTITDVPVLRITSIEEIDPLTQEPTGFILDGSAGYGQGGYGQGGYGVGEGAHWRMVVNQPELRFSMYEDSYLVLNGGFEGLSFRINYEWVPEIEDYHNFVRSERERVLDGDILMKHFIPAYVSGTIRYKLTDSNTTAPSNEALTAMLKDFINKMPANTELQYSDVLQFIARAVDPFDRYGAFIEPFQLKGVIHNTDGSVTMVKGTSKLEVPTFTPIYTKKPLSPRIAHWLADNIVLERM